MKNKTCDTLCQEILEGFGNCLALGTTGTTQAAQSYENFVLVSRVNKNYNIVTIADNNLQLKISRDWLADGALKVEVSEIEDHESIEAFLTEICDAETYESNRESIDKELELVISICGQLYDTMKAQQ